jgi:hypothetical protein
MRQDELDRCQDKGTERSDENEQERFKRQTEMAKDFPDGSFARDKILWDRDRTRKGHAPALAEKIAINASWIAQKTPTKFDLSSGQQSQAKAEIRSALSLRATKKILDNPASSDIKYYQNFIAEYVSSDECLKEIGGKKIDDCIICPTSIDKPVVVDGENTSSLLGNVSDDRADAEAQHNLEMLDLEQKYAGIILKTNPNISLDAVFKLYAQHNYNIKITCVAKYFAPQHFTEKELKAFYDRLHRHLTSNRVKALLESYLGGMVLILICTILMADWIDL